ncbi:hypothetical protein TNCV_3028501 [Trichonephila clavipes]|nr:hypothetical protein TNCV_3028501 [Trichonephila clavipes]
MGRHQRLLDAFLAISFAANECRCKNGRCVKDGKQDVCECFPEFAKINATDCKYCDCGPGFNCTFRNRFGTVNKVCECTDDYLQWDKKCKLKCSKDRPCQNGGSCYSERCECPRDVSGDLCEIYPYCSKQCYPKEIVDCFYNPKTRFYRCACKNRSLTYYENDQDCKRNDEAHFWLNGYVNKQNCRIWSEANPQVYVETPLHPQKLTVWCALWAGGILLQKR